MLQPLHLLFNGHPRRVRVCVPSHPGGGLLILFDGQNVFDDVGSFAGGWYSHEAVAGLPKTVPRPMIVGIDHGNHHRNRELWVDLDAMLSLVMDRLLPVIRARWEIAGMVALGGASLGGLAALAGLLRYPEVFGGALCMSPSFWYAGGAIFQEIPPLLKIPPEKALPPGTRIYIDVGHKEGRLMYPTALRMVDTLHACGFSEDKVGEKRLMWRPDARGRHNEKHWRRRFPKALRFMFRA